MNDRTRIPALFCLLLFSVGAFPTSLFAFCGFYVGKADASLYNKASQVVLVRNENKTVISMASDYKGKLKEFAMVVPVPSVLKKGQINVGDKKLFERIDAFSAPRLVEYFDPDPCQVRLYDMRAKTMAAMPMAEGALDSTKSLGVTVEASYTVGEYDIVILSAKESGGLETWLRKSGYKIPKGARKALKPYIKMNMKFFVAKVNLKEKAKTGLTYLRPLQMAFESKKFMLPIRLGMINADGPQDLLIYVLTQNGRVETTNYRTVKIPTGMDIPVYVKNDFSNFYKDMFSTQVKKENRRAVFTEYFWNMGWCDPCAANPLTPEELKGLGVFWLDSPPSPQQTSGQTILPRRRPRPRPGGAQPVLVTRLHVRYDNEHFPDDLMFQETSDKQNFQGRYVLRHAWEGNPNKCKEADTYLKNLKKRHEKEAQTLASLTGWNINSIRKKIGMKGKPPKPTPWWESLWD